MGAPVPTTQEPLTIDPTLRARLQEYQRRGRTDLQRSLLQSYEQARGLQPENPCARHDGPGDAAGPEELLPGPASS